MDRVRDPRIRRRRHRHERGGRSSWTARRPRSSTRSGRTAFAGSRRTPSRRAHASPAAPTSSRSVPFTNRGILLDRRRQHVHVQRHLRSGRRRHDPRGARRARSIATGSEVRVTGGALAGVGSAGPAVVASGGEVAPGLSAGHASRRPAPTRRPTTACSTSSSAGRRRARVRRARGHGRGRARRHARRSS